MSQVIYTIAVIVAIFLVLLLLKGVFIRRARVAQLAIHANPTETSNTARPQSVFVTPTTPSIPRPERTARGRRRGGDLDTEVPEQLPKYEAAPPAYDAIFKTEQPGQAEGIEMSEGSGVNVSSASTRDHPEIATDAAPPRPSYHEPEGRGGDAVINVGEAPSGSAASGAAPAAIAASTSDNSNGRAPDGIWSRLLGR